VSELCRADCRNPALVARLRAGCAWTSGPRLVQAGSERFRGVASGDTTMGSASPTGCNTGTGVAAVFDRTARTPALRAVRPVSAGQILNRTAGQSGHTLPGPFRGIATTPRCTRAARPGATLPSAPCASLAPRTTPPHSGPTPATRNARSPHSAAHDHVPNITRLRRSPGAGPPWGGPSAMILQSRTSPGASRYSPRRCSSRYTTTVGTMGSRSSSRPSRTKWSPLPVA
jgi:hypothetical protein